MDRFERIGDTIDILGEGPVWDPGGQTLWWVDIRAPAVRCYDWRSGQTRSFPMAEMVGSLALNGRGSLLLAMQSALAKWDPLTGKVERLAAPEAHRPHQRFNDGKCDRQGRFYAGTMNDVAREPDGTLYRFDGRECLGVQRGITIPNSLAWSPDGRTMTFADSWTREIGAYEYEPATAAIGPRRVLATIKPPAIPDGATFDAEGYLWCALYDGWKIARFTPDGRLDRTIALPVQRPTSCQFGGPNLDMLLVTSASQKLTAQELARQPLAGALLAYDVGVKGVVEPRFAG
jgi:sugar lactone lactonase YvrE